MRALRNNHLIWTAASAVLALVLAGILPFTFQAVIDGWVDGGEAWIGHLLFALAGCLWAGFTVLSKRWHFDPWEVTAAVQTPESFVAGPATAVALARTTANGKATDAHQWLVNITLVSE